MKSWLLHWRQSRDRDPDLRNVEDDRRSGEHLWFTNGQSRAFLDGYLGGRNSDWKSAWFGLSTEVWLRERDL